MELANDVLAHALARAKAAGAAQVDALLVSGDSVEARVRGDEIDFVKQARERVLGVRAFVSKPGGLAVAIAKTSDLAPDVVAAVAADAVELARASGADPHAGLPESGFASDSLDLALFDPRDQPLDVEARIDAARRAERAARETDPRISNSEGSSIGSSSAEVAFASSAGFRGAYRSARHSLFAMPIAKQNGSMQTDYWLTRARSLAELATPESVGRRAAERALRRLGARSVPTTRAPVIFDPLTAASLVGQLAGCASGGAVYRGASFLAGKLGERIGAASLTVIDDGRVPGGLASRPFDGEGLATRRTELVRDGVLSSWVLDTYSARKLGLASTGSAARGAGSGPAPSTTNLWLEPGPYSQEEIIAATPRGLLVTGLIGMGFNPVTGDYSRGASGLWIENGEIAYPVEEVTIAANFADMLRGIDMIGRDLLWLGSTAAPSLRIAEMTIAGKS